MNNQWIKLQSILNVSALALAATFAIKCGEGKKLGKENEFNYRRFKRKRCGATAGLK